jgi:hypothetical protein
MNMRSESNTHHAQMCEHFFFTLIWNPSRNTCLWTNPSRATPARRYHQSTYSCSHDRSTGFAVPIFIRLDQTIQHGLHSRIITTKKHMHKNQNKAKKKTRNEVWFMWRRMVWSMCWANIYYLHCKTESSTMKLTLVSAYKNALSLPIRLAF